MSHAIAVAEELERRMLLSVSLLKDIDPGNLGSNPQYIAAAGSGVVFAAGNDSQVWVSDGTNAGTAPVPGLSMHDVPMTFKGDAYFVGFHQQSVEGLWKSDGTVAGTVAVGTALGDIAMISVGDKFFIIDQDLVSSDGTAAGTVVVAHMPQNFGVDAVSFGNELSFDMAASNGKACFVLRDNTATQRQVWATDGTSAGTHLLIDNIGTNQALVAASGDGGFYIFIAGGPRQGLYKSDGTPAGTSLVALVRGDPSLKNQLAVVGNEAYFTGNDDTNGTQLWQSDGTAAGTKINTIFFPQTAQQFGSFTPFNGGLLYFAVNSLYTGLWTQSGAVLHSFPKPAGWPPIIVDGNRAYFAADDGAHGTQLWATDGTPQNTHPLPINPVGTSNPANVAASANGEVFLSADDGIHGPELWKSDGTAAGTQLVKDINTQPASSTPQNMIDVNGTLFFTATDQYGEQVWKSDGTAAGTVRVTDLNPDEPAARGIQNLTNVNGTVYFTTGSGKLWKTNGTQLGTVQVLAVDANALNGPILDLTPVGNELFFAVVLNDVGLQLWRTDGSPAGTFAVAGWTSQFVLNRGNPQITPFRGGVVFQATSASTPQVWYSDGTFAGTRPLTNLPAIPPGGQLSSANLFSSAGVVGDTFYFVDSETWAGPGSTQPVTVHDLWKTDGTPAGTVKLLANFPMAPTTIFNLGGIPEFFATLTTPALWALDPGTGSPTRVVNVPQLPSQTVILGGKLYFFPGAALWVTDGTAAGTQRVAALPSTLNATPGQLTSGAGMIFMNLLFNGIWRSDGTQAGTASIAGTSDATFPPFMAFSGNHLFFSADEPSLGTELFVADAGITGGVFKDANHGIRQSGEAGIAGVTVFLDTNNNGILDPGEPSTVTDSDGNFAFNGLVPGHYAVRQVPPAGDVQTTPLPTTVAAAIGDNAGRGFGDAAASAVPLDFNFLLMLAQHYGQSGSFADGDLNGDGKVDFDDLLLLARNYQQGGSPG